MSSGESVNASVLVVGGSSKVGESVGGKGVVMLGGDSVVPSDCLGSPSSGVETEGQNYRASCCNT